MIQPTVGRVVHFYVTDSKYDFGFNFLAGKPHAALVTYVHGDRMVNLVAFDANGKTYPFTSVALRQPGDPEPMAHSYWCEWMPYQKGQAQKTEELEKALAAQ